MLHQELKDIYDKYHSDLKPLIAEYESRNEKFAATLLHDLPVMFDHIALYDRDVVTNKNKHKEKANESLDNAINNLRTYLIASMMENVKLFQSRFSKQFLMTLDSGKFYGKFKKLEGEVRAQKGQNRYEAYCKLRTMEKMMNDCHAETLAKTLLLDNRHITILKWVITILISLIVNYFIVKLV